MKELLTVFPIEYLKKFNNKPVLCRFLVGATESAYMSGIFTLNESVIELRPVNIDSLQEEVRDKVALANMVPTTTYFLVGNLSYIADLFDISEVDLSV